MGFLDLFGKKDVMADLAKKYPYAMKTEFVPYRLRSRERGSSTLVVNLKNLTEEPVMGSVVVNVPKQLSVDQMGLLKEKEVRLGNLAPKEERDTKIEIYGDVGTEKGEYTITVSAFVHYRDYAHVLNSMKKRAIIEAI